MMHLRYFHRHQLRSHLTGKDALTLGVSEVFIAIVFIPIASNSTEGVTVIAASRTLTKLSCLCWGWMMHLRYFHRHQLRSHLTGKDVYASRL
jgi:hypothetical protein